MSFDSAFERYKRYKALEESANVTVTRHVQDYLVRFFSKFSIDDVDLVDSILNSISGSDGFGILEVHIKNLIEGVTRPRVSKWEETTRNGGRYLDIIFYVSSDEGLVNLHLTNVPWESIANQSISYECPRRQALIKKCLSLNLNKHTGSAEMKVRNHELAMKNVKDRFNSEADKFEKYRKYYTEEEQEVMDSIITKFREEF